MNGSYERADATFKEISKSLASVLAKPLRFTTVFRCGCEIDLRFARYGTWTHRLDDKEKNVVEECLMCHATVLLSNRSGWVDGHDCSMFGCGTCGTEPVL